MDHLESTLVASQLKKSLMKTCETTAIQEEKFILNFIQLLCIHITSLLLCINLETLS